MADAFHALDQVLHILLHKMLPPVDGCFSDVAVQRTQAADFFHSLNQVLHILHNNTSKIECVLFLYLSIYQQ